MKARYDRINQSTDVYLECAVMHTIFIRTTTAYAILSMRTFPVGRRKGGDERQDSLAYDGRKDGVRLGPAEQVSLDSEDVEGRGIAGYRQVAVVK